MRQPAGAVLRTRRSHERVSQILPGRRGHGLHLARLLLHLGLLGCRLLRVVLRPGADGDERLGERRDGTDGGGADAPIGDPLPDVVHVDLLDWPRLAVVSDLPFDLGPGQLGPVLHPQLDGGVVEVDADAAQGLLRDECDHLAGVLVHGGRALPLHDVAVAPDLVDAAGDDRVVMPGVVALLPAQRQRRLDPVQRLGKEAALVSGGPTLGGDASVERDQLVDPVGGELVDLILDDLRRLLDFGLVHGFSQSVLAVQCAGPVEDREPVDGDGIRYVPGQGWSLRVAEGHVRGPLRVLLHGFDALEDRFVGEQHLAHIGQPERVHVRDLGASVSELTRLGNLDRGRLVLRRFAGKDLRRLLDEVDREVDHREVRWLLGGHPVDGVVLGWEPDDDKASRVDVSGGDELFWHGGPPSVLRVASAASPLLSGCG